MFITLQAQQLRITVVNNGAIWHGAECVIVKLPATCTSANGCFCLFCEVLVKIIMQENYNYIICKQAVVTLYTAYLQMFGTSCYSVLTLTVVVMVQNEYHYGVFQKYLLRGHQHVPLEHASGKCSASRRHWMYSASKKCS